MNTADRPFPATLDRVRPRDAIDLMAWPWFSLAKAPRSAPILFTHRGCSLHVSATDPCRGLATIWDGDVLIWAVSQLIEAQDQGLRVQRRMTAPPYQILRFLGRGTSQRQYRLLAAALDRLAATAVETTLHAPAGGAPTAFRLLDSWQRGDGGIELILPEWLFVHAITAHRVLTIDPRYFRLAGGVERWLYRLVRKHAGQQSTGWEISLAALHARAGVLSRPSDFFVSLHRIAQNGTLPGYRVGIAGRGANARLHAVRSAERIPSAAQVPMHKPAIPSTEAGRLL